MQDEGVIFSRNKQFARKVYFIFIGTESIVEIYFFLERKITSDTVSRPRCYCLFTIISWHGILNRDWLDGFVTSTMIG